jgi:hypothetical protein
LKIFREFNERRGIKAIDVKYSLQRRGCWRGAGDKEEVKSEKKEERRTGHESDYTGGVIIQSEIPHAHTRNQ